MASLILVGVCNPCKTLKQWLVSIWTISLVTGLVRGNICPADKVNTTHDVTSATNGEVTIQQGILQQIPCTTFRPGESIALAVWYRGDSDNDPERVRLISNDEDGVKKYALTSNTGLVIKDVTKRDEGNYVCIVVPYTSINRYVVVDVQVIEDKFPAVKADVTTTSSLAESARHRISCPCDTTSSSTVYWSQGAGVTSETDILCSRFPDGTVLQIQRGDDFGIAADNSLILNSLQNTRETARFWCHVFKPDGSSINCYVEAEIVKDEQPSNQALQASETSFYILKGEEQTLPCINQPISEPTCEVQWFKGASFSTTDLLLNYTAWNDVTYDDDSFDIGSDFALVIKSVHKDNGGVYNCRKNSESHSVDVRVIGDTFPLDNEIMTRLEEITFEVGQNYTLECKLGLDRTKARTSIWSYGQKDVNHSTVIGMFKLIDSSVNVEGLKSNSCYSITVDGALQLTGCLIENDVRYWCHVFLDGALNRYYVDLVVQDPSTSFSVIVPIIITIIAFVIIVCLVVLCWKQRRKPFHLRQQNAYVMVEVEDSPETRLIGEVRAEVLKRVESVPVTPWATEDSSCYAPIQDVFTPLELYINQKTTNRTIRYQLESEATIFDDGIPQLKSKHVVLEGKAGSGKTTLLHKLAFDMYNKKAEAILRQVLVVFVLPADLLLQYDNLGKAVVQQLPKHTNISPESVNSFCKNHTTDVAILVDDCDNVGQVTKFIRNKALLGAYVVMATRQIRESDYSSELTIRHITVSGFTPENARSCIQHTLKDSADRSKELIEYLDEHILPPDVGSLPLNLTALCQLSLWTKGEVFRQQDVLTTSELFCKLVKCLFEHDASKTEPQGKGLGNGNGQITEGHQLTRDQQELLIKFGQVVLPRVVENPGTFCELSKADLNQPVENKKTAFDEGVRVGLLRVRVRGPASETEKKAHFVLEILQDLCAGISLTRTNDSLAHWLEKMLPSGSIVAKVFIFAGLSSYNAHPSVLKEITRVQNDISRALKNLTPLFGTSINPTEWQQFPRPTHKQMQVFEICLQLHYESRGEVSFPIGKFSSMTGEVKIRLAGVSSHKLRLLSYFLKNVKTNEIMGSKIKSIKLLRLGKHPSKELRKYLEDFLPYVFEDADKEMSELKESDSENLTLGALLERVESTLRSEKADMSPKYSPSDLDIGVLLALQSQILQDIMLSQSGECFLSTPAKDFAQCLLNLKNLKKIVLIGSILSSEAICKLARNLGKLPQLKRLDLRLNKHIDDDAFLEVTKSVSSCRSLVDLRLSLYNVTLGGFDEVTRCIGRDEEAWKRLKTLFLLHGSPTEGFVKFLSNIMKYMKDDEVLNISALSSFDGLSDGAIYGFENAIKSMKSLKKIEIENMEDLRTRINLVQQKQSGSSKDQKQRDNDPPPATKGVENIPTKSENNQDGVGRRDEQETNPGRYVFRY